MDNGEKRRGDATVGDVAGGDAIRDDVAIGDATGGDATGGGLTVVGGRYRDCSFDALAAGSKEETHGPFDRWDQALACWSELSWRNVDDCFIRYTIRDDRGRILTAPPGV